MRDLDVLDYFFRLMEEVSVRLEKAVKYNNVEDAEKMKKIVLDLSNNVSGELV